MTSINSSRESTSRIAPVTGEIAFQASLLALGTALEAAAVQSAAPSGVAMPAPNGGGEKRGD